MKSKLGRALVKIPSLLHLLTGSLIVVSTVVLVTRGYMAVPIHDEWDMMTKRVWWQQETGSALGSFFQRHNEPRIAIPRLIFSSDLSYLSGKGTLNLVALIGVHGILGLLLAWIVGQTLSLTSWPNLALAGGFLVLMFSEIQLKNFLWGFRFSSSAYFFVRDTGFLVLNR